MAKSQTRTNPFYVTLVLVGILFVVTTCAYLVMMVKSGRPDIGATPHPLLTLLDRHGLTALVIELAVLALATFGAIATDEYRNRRASRDKSEKTEERGSAD